MAAYLSSERSSMLKELRTADVVDVIATVRQIRIARCSALSTQKSTGDYSHGKANCPRDVRMRVDLDFHGTSFVVRHCTQQTEAYRQSDGAKKRKQHMDIPAATSRWPSILPLQGNTTGAAGGLLQSCDGTSRGRWPAA